MSLDVSRIVNVGISVSPLALQRAGYGIMNIIGINDSIPISERVRAYDSTTGVAEDFASTDEEYLAAQVFFSQTPRPTTLYISRRAATALPATLYGSSTDVETTISTWQAITDGEFTIDGAEIGGLNFSASSTMSEIGVYLDGELDSSGYAVEWDGERFIFTNQTAGSAETMTYLSAVVPGAGTDIHELLGGTSTSAGALLEATGTDAETITESLDAIEVVNSKWYGFSFTKEVRDASITSAGTNKDCLDAGAWAEARTKLFANNSSDANTLISTNTTNISYLIEQLGYDRTFTVYNAGSYPAISAFARGATVDFDGTDTTITYKFKQLPGIIATDLSASKANALIGFNCNYYAEFGTQLSGDSVSILTEGVVASGRLLDEVVGIDWLQNAILTDVFNYIYQSTTKIPQTNEGVAGIAQVLENDLAQAVTNGLAAPGQVTIDGREIFLDKGYLVFTTPVEEQSQASREAREAPPISFILKGAGAIHSVTITGTFVR